MRKYEWIYQHALEQKGGVKALEALLPQAKSAAELAVVSDDRYLSEISRRVFRAGLKHEMVDKKWPAFEEVFYNFEPNKLVLMSDEALENTLQDKRIIRHWGKIKSIRHNALMLVEVAQQYGSFGKFLAQWPTTDIVGLWKWLVKQGKQLGGNSGPYFLRMVGKDTFVLTNDVVAALVAQGIVDKKPTSQTDLQLVQAAFNQWQEQSGRPLCQISRMLAFCVG
ncbi:MAG: DNA-3-methyladenine glycosylase I [Pseudomonadales bacterium]|nr:DNA-3-methyladenine glycosylase I [Pseudomonadales bacterium]MCP5302614.1 DNA-3-methyladenine glycosylase I [Pseudomonadales bacterium]